MKPAVDARARFGVMLLAIAAGAAVLRVGYVEIVGPHARLFADSGWYQVQASNIRSGVGYIDVARELGFWNGMPVPHGHRATAYWPPAYPAFLAAVQRAFGTSVFVQRVAGAATGAASVAVTGLLGRAVGGHRVGVLAALIVAVNPLLIAVDGSLMSETLYVPLVLLALLLAHAARNRPTFPAWSALGAVVALATLARQDAILLVVFAMIPAAVLAGRAPREIVPRVAVGLLVLAAVLAPWVLRNEAKVGQATIATVSGATVVAGSNCRPAYHGSTIGYWVGECVDRELGFRTSEVAYSDHTRAQGVRYALHHLGSWPAVVTARVARVWGLWSPTNQARLDHVESRNRQWQVLVWPVSLILLVLGIAGLRVLARQSAQIAMLVVPIAMTTFIAVATYGNTRWRAPAECTLAIGAAATLLAIWDRVAPARRSRSAA
jgi:4-amino-4-deoxy-L-arabinose transferase-like glycosyltransferase